jgi:general L-amino acid transport system substrate-binding protein
MSVLASCCRGAAHRSGARALALAGLVCALFVSPSGAETLAAVRARGALVCGVSQGLAGFSSVDDKGEWSGFDVDFCRALAAAILGDPLKVTFVPLSTSARFDALSAGAVDLLARNTTWTMSRETQRGFLFAGISYFDGQGFLVRKARGAISARELAGAKVCVQSGTTTETNLADYFGANGLALHVVSASSPADARTSYESGLCDAVTSDVSQLHAERLALGSPTEHIILPDIISKEPLGPVVRGDDMAWFNLVKWVHFALINAEELGVDSKGVDAALRSTRPDVRRLVGTEGALGESLGLSNEWAARAIRAVGHYGEIFERNVGAASPLRIPRGLNQLWSMGGLQYAPPLR